MGKVSNVEGRHDQLCFSTAETLISRGHMLKIYFTAMNLNILMISSETLCQQLNYIDGWVQECSISITNVLWILQSHPQPWIFLSRYWNAPPSHDIIRWLDEIIHKWVTGCVTGVFHNSCHLWQLTVPSQVDYLNNNISCLFKIYSFKSDWAGSHKNSVSR